MSSHNGVIHLTLEWSPDRVTVLDPLSGGERIFSNALEAVGALGVRDVDVAISRRSIFVRSTRVPNLGADEVRQIVNGSLGDLFPLPAEDLAFDIHLTDNIDPEGRLAIIAAMPSLQLRRMRSEMREAGFRVHNVFPVALGSAVIAREIGESDGAVVQPVEGGYAIDLVAGGELRYSRIVGRSAELEPEICRTFTTAKLTPGPIIAIGGLNLPEAQRRAPESSLRALTKPDASRVKMHLELPETLAARARTAYGVRLRFSVIAAVVAFALAGYAFVRYTSAQKELAQSKSATAAATSSANKAQRLAESNAEKAASILKDIQVGFQPAQTFSDLLTLSTNRVPEGVWLTGITLERGRVLQIRGTAKTSEQVATYLQRLSNEPRLRDVKLVFVNNSAIEKTPVVQFSISAFPVGNLPIMQQQSGGKL